MEIFEAAAAHILVLPDGQLCRVFALAGQDPVPVQRGGAAALAETLAPGCSALPGQSNAQVPTRRTGSG